MATIRPSTIVRELRELGGKGILSVVVQNTNIALAGFLLQVLGEERMSEWPDGFVPCCYRAKQDLYCFGVARPTKTTQPAFDDRCLKCPLFKAWERVKE